MSCLFGYANGLQRLQLESRTTLHTQTCLGTKLAKRSLRRSRPSMLYFKKSLHLCYAKHLLHSLLQTLHDLSVVIFQKPFDPRVIMILYETDGCIMSMGSDCLHFIMEYILLAV